MCIQMFIQDTYEALRCMYVHPTCANTPNREPFGVTRRLDVGKRSQGRGGRTARDA